MDFTDRVRYREHQSGRGHARYGVNTAVHAGVAAGRSRTVATAEAARLARVAELGYPDDPAGYFRDRYVARRQ
jgi:hypothetical protein